MAVRPGREIKGPFITGGNPDTVNDVFPATTTVGSAYDLRGQLGAVYRTPDGIHECIYVQFSATSTGTAPAPYQPCYWVANTTANLATANAWVVDNNVTSNTGTVVTDVAGILRNACTRGNGVWLLRRSEVMVPVLGTATATTAGVILGNALIASTSSSSAVPVVFSSSTAGSIQQASRIGWLASTSATPTFVGSTSTVGIGTVFPVFLDIE